MRVTFADVAAAAERLRDAGLRTPCLPSEPLSQITGARIFVKLDNLQRTGSFKERGARNALLLLDAGQRRRGVIAASAGNHALGLAHWFHNDVPASVTALKTAVALNQGSAEIVADLGLFWSLRGEWNRAVPLLEEARGRRQARGTSCSSGLSLYHFARGRYEEALSDAVEIKAPDAAHGFVISNVCETHRRMLPP